MKKLTMKKLITILLALALCLTLLPAGASAAETDWTGWTALTADTTELNGGTTGAKYYLSGDLDITDTITVKGGTKDHPVVLDLNGHVLKMTGTGRILNVGDSDNAACFVMQDSGTTGAITGGNVSGYREEEHSGGGVYVASNSSFTMTGGSITNCTAKGNFSGRAGKGGGVYVKGGSFTMTGGSIDNCKNEGPVAGSCGGGVSVALSGGLDDEPGGSFTMSGGSITNCSSDKGGGVSAAGLSFTMTGGVISDCKSTASVANGGGGVYLTGGSFTMSGGVIENCTAESWGGGVCSTHTFTMTGGSIKNCTGGIKDGSRPYDAIYQEDGTIYADGGTVDGTVYSKKTKIISSGSSATVFLQDVVNCVKEEVGYGVTSGIISGGIFCKDVTTVLEMQNEHNEPIPSYRIDGGVFCGELKTSGFTETEEKEGPTVTFNYGGTTATRTGKVVGGRFLAPDAPGGAGFVLGGWYTDADCTQAMDSATVADGAILYARWVEAATVTWDFNGGSGSTDGATVGKVGHGTAITAPGTPVKANTVEYTYTFDGWYTEDGTKVTNFGTVSGDVTYYAHYTGTRNKYTVTWDYNGGKLNERDDKTDTLDYGTTITAPTTNPAKDRTAEYTYAFDGWYTAADESGTKVTNFGTVSGDVTYYAHYTGTRNKYTVTWDYNGGTGSTTGATTGSVDYGTTITASTTNPAKDRTAEYTYTFDGWYTAADETGTKVTNFGTVSGDVTYYAHYTGTRNKYTVTWDYNGGRLDSKTDSSSTLDYGTAITAPGTPAKAATAEYTYTFDGWYIEAEGGDKVENFGTVTGDVTYYAHWRTNSSSTVINVESPHTGDPGVALYLALSLFSYTGSVLLLRDRKRK